MTSTVLLGPKAQVRPLSGSPLVVLTSLRRTAGTGATAGLDCRHQPSTPHGGRGEDEVTGCSGRHAATMLGPVAHRKCWVQRQGGTHRDKRTAPQSQPCRPPGGRQ